MAGEAFQQAVEAGELRRAASILEKDEMSWDTSDPWPYHVHQMMLHFATDDVEMARLAWERMTADAQADADARKWHGLLEAVGNVDLPAAWASLPVQVPQGFEGVAAEIRRKLLESALETVQSAYAAIELGRLAAMCNVDAAEAARLAGGRGWSVEGGMVVVPEGGVASDEALPLGLERLARRVVDLE